MKKLRNSLLALGGLAAILTVGCETPGGAMFMSALGAASMAKGGTPKQMAIASAYKNIGDASLAMQQNRITAEAIESAGRSVGEGLDSRLGGRNDPYNRRVWEEDSTKASTSRLKNYGVKLSPGSYIWSEATAETKDGKTLQLNAIDCVVQEGYIIGVNEEKWTPAIDKLFHMKSWRDSNGDGTINKEELNSLSGEVDLEELAKNSETIIFKGAFGFRADQKFLRYLLRDDRGNTLLDFRYQLNVENDLTQDNETPLADNKNPWVYLSPSPGASAGWLIDEEKKKGVTPGSFSFSWILDEKEVYV